ncbi:MAG: RluA family pseudouridine synthase [Candidatus Pacebacteria bacterium]|jgi:23S rRNA pseudouridine1911/1915/1917 synthase|nr:RluA family pseudouridine synthase [Candidatus Paceibacterota bacterium]MBT3511962.1 RluA family pseudouridine synthase [Candidatus Paceibacterota bacterium]MBT4005284.1 RluA family pseudouridine synthase [Candidatus Paceibacterota bacterium]MBT4358503.1 RluA family pseudouridine synthase [Candidatus Paceibacterota bacterium]MBT4681151.1 RluA family pseudouridine synthase [Candidatus Paceibacterota bacterium]
MKVEIIFEDQDILVVNKPAGMVSNSAQSVKEPSLQDWLVEKTAQNVSDDWKELVPADFNNEYGTVEEIFKERAGLVHRLDKDTSGVMVAAKNPGSLVNLLAQFRERKTSKKYTCLAHGKFRVPQGNIIAPLGRSRTNRQKFDVSSDGRSATTEYKVIDYYPDLNDQGLEKLKEFKKNLSSYQGFSLVNCWPKTGRTHQIRVHLKHWKHPLVGDDKYVGKKRVKLDEVWCPRQFLHASQINFIHPRTGKKVSFEVELAEDLRQALSFLNKSV